MGHGGGECRVPSLTTSAVKREVFNSYFFSFFFDVPSMGQAKDTNKHEAAAATCECAPSETIPRQEALVDWGRVTCVGLLK